uniref:Transcription factor TFIID n=1 Tax=Pithovirus LCPAC101 TaxID=2506586 RepID=A0A481Z4S7_9VIRU|nr:MAG: transcription factor TFIID [Pithovirus LCPAC101]
MEGEYLQLSDFDKMNITNIVSVIHLDGEIDMDVCTNLIVINHRNYKIVGRKKKNNLPSYVHNPGDIIFVGRKNIKRGIIRSEKNNFKNAMIVDIACDDKFLNARVSKNKIHFTGARSTEMVRQATSYLIKNIKYVQNLLDNANDNPKMRDKYVNHLINSCRGDKFVVAHRTDYILDDEDYMKIDEINDIIKDFPSDNKTLEHNKKRESLDDAVESEESDEPSRTDETSSSSESGSPVVPLDTMRVGGLMGTNKEKICSGKEIVDVLDNVIYDGEIHLEDARRPKYKSYHESNISQGAQFIHSNNKVYNYKLDIKNNIDITDGIMNIKCIKNNESRIEVGITANPQLSLMYNEITKLCNNIKKDNKKYSSSGPIHKYMNKLYTILLYYSDVNLYNVSNAYSLMNSLYAFFNSSYFPSPPDRMPKKDNYYKLHRIFNNIFIIFNRKKDCEDEFYAPLFVPAEISYSIDIKSRIKDSFEEGRDFFKYLLNMACSYTHYDEYISAISNIKNIDRLYKSRDIAILDIPVQIIAINYNFHLGRYVNIQKLVDAAEDYDSDYIIAEPAEDNIGKVKINIKCIIPDHLMDQIYRKDDSNVIFHKFTIFSKGAINQSGKNQILNKQAYETFIKFIEDNKDTIFLPYQ